MREFPIRDEHDDTLNDGDPRTGYELDECEVAATKSSEVVDAVRTIDAQPNLQVACLKHWWESKTIWTNAATIAVALYEMMARYKNWPPIPTEVFIILGALGIYARKATNAVIR